MAIYDKVNYVSKKIISYVTTIKNVENDNIKNYNSVDKSDYLIPYN